MGQADNIGERVGEFFDAVEARDLAKVQALLDAGMDVNARHSWRSDFALAHAVGDPVDFELLRLLLEHGADVDATLEATGGTALHQLLHASLEFESLLKAIRLMLSHGADINAMGTDWDGDEYTVVDIAAAEGPRMQKLLEALKDLGGQTAEALLNDQP